MIACVKSHAHRFKLFQPHEPESICDRSSSCQPLAVYSHVCLSPRKRSLAIRPANNALAARGFNELYNMDYDPAIRDFSELRDASIQTIHSRRTICSGRGVQGTLTASAHSIRKHIRVKIFSPAKPRRPLDMAAQERIFALIARVESLCNARLQKNPNDTDALYARGVARGFRSTYIGMAENRGCRRFARRLPRGAITSACLNWTLVCGRQDDRGNPQLHHRFAELGGTRGGGAGGSHRQSPEGARLSARSEPLEWHFEQRRGPGAQPLSAPRAAL